MEISVSTVIWVLVASALVYFMQAGFALCESGLRPLYPGRLRGNGGSADNASVVFCHFRNGFLRYSSDDRFGIDGRAYKL